MLKFKQKGRNFSISILIKAQAPFFNEIFRYIQIPKWVNKCIIFELNFFEDKIILICYGEALEHKERKT